MKLCQNEQLYWHSDKVFFFEKFESCWSLQRGCAEVVIVNFVGQTGLDNKKEKNTRRLV